MGSITTFDARVAARTRAANEILSNKELLTLYQSHGGLREDLEAIAKQGQAAETLSQARSGSKATGEAATLDVLAAFTGLQKEYSAVMAVVQAVRLDLQRAGAENELVQAVDSILQNEAAVTYRPIATPSADNKRKRQAVTSKSQEAVRAEIHKDAVALLALSDAHPALKKRGVTPARLTALRDAAGGLSSQLSERSNKKGAGKDATLALRTAVDEQKTVWSACYRILAAAAQEDSRIRQLLKDAKSKD